MPSFKKFVSAAVMQTLARGYTNAAGGSIPWNSVLWDERERRNLCFLIGWLNYAYLPTHIVILSGCPESFTFYLKLQVSKNQLEMQNLQRIAIRNLSHPSPVPTDIPQCTYIHGKSCTVNLENIANTTINLTHAGT